MTIKKKWVYTKQKCVKIGCWRVPVGTELSVNLLMERKSSFEKIPSFINISGTTASSSTQITTVPMGQDVYLYMMIGLLSRSTSWIMCVNCRNMGKKFKILKLKWIFKIQKIKIDLKCLERSS
jgi:hypothetical protein